MFLSVLMCVFGGPQNGAHPAMTTVRADVKLHRRSLKRMVLVSLKCSALSLEPEKNQAR